MAAETLAFGDAFDAAFTIREELSALVGHRVPMLMLTDSAGLFDSMTRYKRTTEGRLKLDICAAREAYKRGDLHNIALIRTQYNVADAMTKVPGNNALLNLLMTHKIDHPVVQYVMDARANNDKHSLLRGA
jgi:hypothetical protein